MRILSRTKFKAIKQIKFLLLFKGREPAAGQVGVSATGQTGRWLYVAARRQELAIEYKALAKSSAISTQRAILLKSVARTLTGLANQLDRLASLTRDEGVTYEPPMIAQMRRRSPG